MNNYSKMTLFVGVIFLAVSSIAQVSAQYYTYTPASSAYTDVTDSVSYFEDIVGENRGFSLTHKSTVPRTSVIQGCDYYDWTSDYRKCRRTAYYNGYTQDYYGYSDSQRYDNYRANYDQDKAVQQAFKTFQKDSDNQFKLDSQRLNLRYQRRYGGYGYGYSGARYSSYRWGW